MFTTCILCRKQNGTETVKVSSSPVTAMAEKVSSPQFQGTVTYPIVLVCFHYANFKRLFKVKNSNSLGKMSSALNVLSAGLLFFFLSFN